MEIGHQNTNNGAIINEIELEKKSQRYTNGRYGPQVIKKRHSNEITIMLTITKILIY